MSNSLQTWSIGSNPDWDAIRFDMTAVEKAAGEAARKKCEYVIERWNEMVRVRRSPDPSPTVGVALTAKYHWLQVYCPACRSMSEIDHAHPKATLSSLIPRLSCERCCPNSPFAKLKGVTKFSETPYWRSLSHDPREPGGRSHFVLMSQLNPECPNSIQFLATIQGQTAAMEEHRKHPRHRALKAGKIIFNRRLSVVDCVVRNLSDIGASLEIGSPVGLPETFDLSIPMDGLKRSCRVSWKSTTRIGVKFQ